MTDKELIKQEIERLKHNTPNAYDLSRFMLLEEIESFIDSLPEEPASKDLEEEIDNYFKDWTFDDEMSVMVKPNHYFAEFNDIKEIARHFAEWQKEKLDKQFGFLKLKDCKDAYNEWKSTQDEPSAALAWIRACEWQKQQMMKDAVEGTIKYEIGSAAIPQCDRRYQVLSDQVYIPNAKLGDKVKIIIVKE